MSLHRVFVVLSAWALLASGLTGQLSFAVPPVETIARMHWQGMNRVSVDTNATEFMKVWQLPTTKALMAQTLDKLSLAPWRLLHRNLDTNAAALLRPLLDDVVANESYQQIRSVIGQPEQWAFAIRLDDRRAALWQTNLAAVVESLTGIHPVPAPQGSYGWSLKKHHAPDLIELTRVGGWTVVGAAEDFNGLIAELRARTQRNLPPWNVRLGSDWLEADLNPARLLPILTTLFSQSPGDTTLNSQLSTLNRLYLAITGDTVNVVTHGTADFSQPLDLPLSPWQIPTNLIHGPLTSLTAVRGIAPWLSTTPAWQKLQFTPAPDQAYVWSQAGGPFQTYLVAPLPGASNQIWQLSNRLVQNGNPWLAAHAQGNFQWATNAPPHLVWNDALILSPWLVPMSANQRDYAVGGLYAVEPGDLDVPAQAMLHAVLNTTNLVFYQSERTGSRIEEGFFITQLFRVVFKKAQLPSGAKTTLWLKNIESQLNTTTTLVTKTSPTELAFARESTIGFTAIELHLLADWLESPQFPHGLHTFLAPPEKQP